MREITLERLHSVGTRPTGWSVVVAALMVATLYASSASASPQQLTIGIQQTTANPVLTRAVVNYRVTVANTGRDAQDNVQVRVSFPGEQWRIPASGVGADCTYAGGGGAPTALVTCTAGRIPGSSAFRTFTVQIVAPSRVMPINSINQRFTITAGLDVNGALSGTGGADATATVATDVLALPDLDPQWSGPLSITAGADAAYTLRLRNTGDGVAGGASVRITLPEGVDYVRVEESTFSSCQRLRQEINCSKNLDSILPGREASVRVIVRPRLRGFLAVAGGTQVLLSAGADPSGSVRESHENNNTAFIITTVRSRAELAVGGTFSFKDYPEITLIPTPPPCGSGIPSRGRLMVADLKIKNWGPGVSPATTVRVDWNGLNVRAVSLNDCGAGACCERGSCVPRSGGCPSTNYNPDDSSASVPSLDPFAEIAIRVVAVADVPGFGQHQVEWGSVTLDPNNLVNDSNRLDNRWTMRP